MKRLSLRHPLELLVLCIASVLAVACSGKNEASQVAKAFLQAYYVDLDFAKALQLSSDISHQAINEQAELISLNPYAKEETPDIVFKTIEMDADNSNMARYIYICNRVERSLPLHKLNGKWLVDLQGGTVESDGNSDYSALSTQQGGFAVSTSGEIQYKTRRQGKQQ